LFGTVWDKLYNAIVGEADESSKEAAEDAQKAAEIDAISGAQPKVNAWQKFVSKLGETISHIWEELPVWIANGIELAVAAINEIVSNVGDWLKGIGVQKEVEKTAETVTSEATEGMAKSAEDGEDKEEPKLVTAIKNIGERIKTLFVETIPKFIQDAWIAISKLGSEVFEGLSSIFTGEIPKSEVGKAVGEFGQTIYDFITTDIPNFLKKAFQFIEQLFGGASNNIGKIGGDFDVFDPMANNIKKRAKAANKKIEKDTEKSGFWSFVDSLKESFLKAFQSIGPAILNGIATALNWIGDIATIIVDALTGKKSISDQVDEVYGEQKPELREALKNIGESIKNFFLDTIPKFIGSAIGTLAKEAPKWFEKLFGAMNAAAEEESKEATEGGGAAKSFGDSIESATGVLDIVKRIFNELTTFVGENKDIIEIIGVIVALTLLFSKLSDLFGMADEFEEGARAIKWTAITIAIAAIAGIMSYITTLVSSGDTEKIDKFEEIIDKIKDLMTAIAAILGMSAIGKLFDALGEKWENGEASKFNLKDSLLGKISDAFGGFLTTLGIGTAGNIVAGMTTTTIAQSMETLGSAFEILGAQVDETLEQIKPFVQNLASMDNDLVTAIQAAEKLKTLFDTFYKAFDALFGEAQAHYEERRNSTDLKELSIDEFFDNLFNRVELFNRMSAFISMLADSLSKFSNIENVESEMDRMIGVLTTSKFGDFLKNMLNLLKKSFDASDISAKELGVADYLVPQYTSGVAVGLEILSDALSVFSNGISGFDESTVNAFDKTLDVFQKLADAFEKTEGTTGWVAKYLTGDSSLSAIGTEIKLFGSAMKSFYDSISKVKGLDNSDEISLTEGRISALLRFTKGLGDSMDETLSGYGSTASLIDTVTEKLPGFADAVVSFFTRLNSGFETENNITPERMNMLVSATEGMANMLHSINELTSMLRSNSEEDLSKVLNKIFGGLESREGLRNINKISSLILAFDQAIIKVMETEDFSESYKTIGENVASKLFEGIQAAFDEDPNLRIQITPVLKLDDTIKEQLRHQMADAGLTLDTAPLAQNAQNANAQTDEERIKSADLYQHIDDVKSAVDTLKESQATVDQITSAFAKLNMYINKNVLVGEIAPDIDAKIGEYIALLNLGVTTP